MKEITFIALSLFLVLSGAAALAHQSGEQKEGSSMRGMMQQMMGGETAGRDMSGGMKGMVGMMRMMGQMEKMADLCISAHESMHAPAGEQKEGEKK